MSEGLYLKNPETGEIELVPFEELDDLDARSLERPVGGFCYRADIFKQLVLAEVPFYVHGWLPKQGRLCLYGAAKLGKTHLALQLARCIGAGEPFVGRSTAKGVVLYLNFEIGAGTLQERMKNTGADYENVYVGNIFDMKLDTIPGRERLTKAIEAIRPAVVVLDPFYKLMFGDENETKDVRGILDFLDKLISEYKTSFVIMHHTGKDIRLRGRGSSVLEGWVDSYIELKRVATDNPADLKVKVTPIFYRHAPLDDSFEVLLRDGEFEIAVGLTSIASKILMYMEKNPEYAVTPKALVDAGVGSRRAVFDALEKLCGNEEVMKVGRGSYQLPPQDALDM